MDGSTVAIATLVVTAITLLLNVVAAWQREHQRRAQKKMLQYKEEQLNGRDEH